MAKVYAAYEQRKHAAGALDFDDLIVEMRPPVPRPSRGPAALPGALPLPPGGRVPGHEPRAVPAGQHAGRALPQRVRGGRRRPGRLQLARRHHREPPGLRARLSRRHGLPDGAELPLHAEHPGGRERADRAQRAAQAQEPVDRGRHRRAHGALPRGQRARGGLLRRRGGRAAPRVRGLPVRRRRGLLPHERAVPRDRGRADARGHALPGVRRRAVLPAPGDQGRAGLPAPAGEPAGRHQLPPRGQHAQARDRRRHGGRARVVRARRGHHGGGGVPPGGRDRRAADAREGRGGRLHARDGGPAGALGGRRRPGAHGGVRRRRSRATSPSWKRTARWRPRAGSRTCRSCRGSRRS